MTKFDGYSDTQILRFIKEHEIEIVEAKKVLAERKALRRYTANPFVVKGEKLKIQIMNELGVLNK